MAITITWNGISYSVPITGEVGWGENLTSLFVALPAGALQKTGGAFTLTGEADFGANYGLKALSFKGRAGNAATAGVLRLASSETVAWRNTANSANLPLGINGSDQLTFDGVPVAVSGGGTVNVGAAGYAAVYPANGTTVDDSVTLSGATTKLLLSGPYISGPPSVTYTLPPLTSDGTVVMASGLAGQTISVPTIFAVNSLRLQETGGGSDTIAIAVAAISSGHTYTMPDAGGDASFVMTAGAQTITGDKTFNTNCLRVSDGSGGNVAVSLDTLSSGNLVYTLPDCRASANFVMSEGAQTINGTKEFTGQLQLSSAGGGLFAIDRATIAGDLVFTLPDTGGHTDFAMCLGTQTIGGAKTFTSPVAMSNQKITGLADGTVATDAATYGQVTTAIAAGIPAGVILPYGGSSAPTGYLLCDGTSYLRATYPTLFAVIGTTFGSADGTHFTVPDSRSRSLMGAGTGSGLSARTLGANVGAETDSTALATFGAPGTGSAGTQVCTSSAGTDGLYTSTAGVDTLQPRKYTTNSFSVVQPNLVVTHIIKT